MRQQANVAAGTLTLLDRKRLELARALATDPKVLLLDEIAGGLTEGEIHELVRTIKEIHASGVSIIWIEHIVHALLDGPKGFNELGRLVGGCNPTTLTQRLARLEDLGVLHKESGPVGGRCSYSLTEAGLGLERVITAIRSWASAHLRDA